jgi:AcrR family transcriptional regulator
VVVRYSSVTNGDRSAAKEPTHSERGAATVDRALRVVGEILDEGGDGSLRLADVSRRSGVSIGSLYHHFGSREGLIRAARERQFEESLPEQSADETAYLIASATPEEFIERFEELQRASETPERAAGRRRRFEMIGAAAGHPGQLDGIVDLQADYLDRAEQIATMLKERGWLREGVEPRAVALFMHSTSMARVLRELDRKPVEPEAWGRVVHVTYACLFASSHDSDEARRAS